MSRYVSSRIAGFRQAIRASVALVALVAGPAAHAATTLTQFTGYPSDGASPAAKLLTVSCGTHVYLWGTTQNGGTYNQGTVYYSAFPFSNHVVVHSFSGSATDGALPYSGLIKAGAYLFGTTAFGGSSGLGTVYRLPLTSLCTGAAPTTVHSFGGAGDGQAPVAALLKYNGVLYGTTAAGGGSGNGTVYEWKLGGGYTVLHSFTGGPSDGAEPASSLIFAGLTVNGTGEKALFGTTVGGGSSGNGTIFSVSATGVEQVLWNFTGGADGAAPMAELLKLGQHLYSTASAGGSGPCKCGTVFGFVPSNLTMGWNYSFAGNPSDGETPYAGLVWNGTALYGTTSYGGATSTNCPSGCGTVFKIGSNGFGEALDFSFDNLTTGEFPVAGLDLYTELFYGTSVAGIGSNSGTMFSTP